MYILTNNFINILRYGAFDEGKSISVLSAYKWGQLTLLAEHHNVLSYFANGLEKYYFDENLNIPQSEIDSIRHLLEETPRQTFTDLYNFDKIHLHNKHYDRQLRNIVKKEYADAEKSYPTMNIMSIIIQSVDQLLTGRSYLRGLIDLGVFLRKDGDKVDFVKLENWLKQSGVSRMSNLLASMLTSVFGFTDDEIPFAESTDKRAFDILERDLHCHETSKLKTWEYRTGRNGFSSGPSAAFRTIGHNLSLWRYAPGEVMSSIGRGILKGLSEIEE